MFFTVCLQPSLISFEVILTVILLLRVSLCQGFRFDQLDHSDGIDAFVDVSLVQGCNFPIHSYPWDCKNDSWQTIKWQHTVLTEPDFLDEWSAQDIAFHLAYEVNGSRPPSTPVDQHVSSCVPRSSQPTSKVAKVSFDDIVQLFIGLDEDQAFHVISIPSQSLDMPDKPWSICSAKANAKGLTAPVDPDEPKSTEPSHTARCQLTQADPCCSPRPFPPAPVQPIVDAGQCEVHASFEGLFDPGSHRPLSRKDWGFGLSIPAPRHKSYPVSMDLLPILNQVTRIDGPKAQGPKHQMREPLHALGTPSTAIDKMILHPMHRHLQPRHAILQDTDVWFSSQCSAATVRFCPVQSCGTPRSHHDTMQHPYIRQCRLEHESPITDLVAHLPADQPPADPDLNWQGRQPPMPPAFVADLSNRFIRMGFDISDGDFDVPLRTWYIDHATIRRWTAPRNLQLVGPPQGWEAQISSIWVDQINPDEWFDVTIIHPDPPDRLGTALSFWM